MERISNKEIPWQCPVWINLEVGYYFLLSINGEKSFLGDVKKRKKKISALLKNEERGVTKPLPMGNLVPTRTPSPALTALSQECSQQRQTGGKCSPEPLKYPKFLKNPQFPEPRWLLDCPRRGSDSGRMRRGGGFQALAGLGRQIPASILG